MRYWLPLVFLAATQFLMVLDQAVMNVAISQLVDDFDSEAGGLRTPISPGHMTGSANRCRAERFDFG